MRYEQLLAIYAIAAAAAKTETLDKELTMNLHDLRYPRQQPRRRFSATILGSAAMVLGAGLLPRTPYATTRPRLNATPRDFEGPYRPSQATTWGGVNLMTTGHGTSPGVPLVLAGLLLDTEGRPQPGLQIQVWQANCFGRYDYHPGETPGHGQPDPAFRGHGQGYTDADGWFAFRTVRPAGYRRTLFGFLPWTFVPHIHIAVRSANRDLLVTQVDLNKEVTTQALTQLEAREQLMKSDAMRQLIAATRESLVESAGTSTGAQLIRFDVVLATPS